MKSFPKSAALSSSQQKVRISKQELERLVQQEFKRLMKQKEKRLDALIENIEQDLGQGLKYEASNKTLQTHMMAVAQRAEQALAYIAQTQTPPLDGTSMAWKGRPAEASVSVKSSKGDLCSPEVGTNPKRIKLEPEEVPYPPLPALPFPSFLTLDATKCNIPPRLKVDLALIQNPSPQLSLVWSLDENDPDAPPMDTYSIYITTEVTKGSNQFDGWKKLGEHAAAPLPMFSLYTKYKLGYKICVSVVGKDKFGRYGPYSKVTCAYI